MTTKVSFYAYTSSLFILIAIVIQLLPSYVPVSSQTPAPKFKAGDNVIAIEEINKRNDDCSKFPNTSPKGSKFKITSERTKTCVGNDGKSYTFQLIEGHNPVWVAVDFLSPVEEEQVEVDGFKFGKRELLKEHEKLCGVRLDYDQINFTSNVVSSTGMIYLLRDYDNSPKYIRVDVNGGSTLCGGAWSNPTAIFTLENGKLGNVVFSSFWGLTSTIGVTDENKREINVMPDKVIKLDNSRFLTLDIHKHGGVCNNYSTFVFIDKKTNKVVYNTDDEKFWNQLPDGEYNGSFISSKFLDDNTIEVNYYKPCKTNPVEGEINPKEEELIAKGYPKITKKIELLPKNTIEENKQKEDNLLEKSQFQLTNKIQVDKSKSESFRDEYATRIIGDVFVQVGVKNENAEIVKKYPKDKEVWLITHGYNDKFYHEEGKDQETNFEKIAQSIQSSHPNSIVLGLDWRQSAAGMDIIKSSFDLCRAGTWIKPTAESVVKHLKEWGLTDGSKLNLVGHSLGSLMITEIAKQYDQKPVQLIALDPPSDNRCIIGGSKIPIQGKFEYKKWWEDILSLDHWKKTDWMERDIFSGKAQITRAFVGRNSLAGNQELAQSADQLISMDFESELDVGNEHGWVNEVYDKINSTTKFTHFNTYKQGYYSSEDVNLHSEFQRTQWYSPGYTSWSNLPYTSNAVILSDYPGLLDKVKEEDIKTLYVRNQRGVTRIYR